MKNLYRIFNLNLGEYGSPFAMCEKDFKKWEKQVAGKIVWEKIGENATIPCNECGK